MYKAKVVVCVKFKGNMIQAAADATRCDGKTATVTWGVDKTATAIMAYDQDKKKFFFFRPCGAQINIMVESIGNDGLAVLSDWGPTWDKVQALPKWSLR
jgi:hypothetical protein